MITCEIRYRSCIRQYNFVFKALTGEYITEFCLGQLICHIVLYNFV